MNILIVNKLYSPWVGGVETIAKQLAEGFAEEKNNNVSVLVCSPKGSGSEEAINQVQVVRASSIGIFKSMPISFSFFGLFKKMSKTADWIDLHHPFPLSFIAFFLFRPKAKLVVHYHSDIVRQKFFGFLLKPFLFWILKRAQYIVVSNPNMIKNSPVLVNFSSKCKVIPFGIDFDKVNQAIEYKKVDEIKSQYGDFVLFAGRLSYYKGVSVLLKAMVGNSSNLVIVGNGTEEQRLKDGVKELGIDNRVFFLPHLPKIELLNFCKAAKVFVLPSIFKSETFGVILLEAMACGTPVISTELGTGTSYVNAENQTGRVVPANDVESLKSALLEILSNQDKHNLFSAAAVQRVQQFFTLKGMIKENLNLFELYE